MSTATLTPTDDPDDFDRIVEHYGDEPARTRFVKSRTEVMSAGEAINLSQGRRRYRTRERGL